MNIKDKVNGKEPEQTQQIEELFLLHLRYKEAKFVESGGNKPILLNDKEAAWIVYSGHVDVFAIPMDRGRVVGSRVHIFRVNAGQAVFGMDIGAVDGRIGIVAVGGNNTSLLKIPTHRLQALVREPDFRPQIIDLLENWVQGLAHSLMHSLPPKESTVLAAGSEHDLTSAENAVARRGLIWVKHIEGKSRFAGNRALAPLNGTGRWPLSNRTWIEAIDDARISAIVTAQYLDEDPTWSSLDNFHKLVLENIAMWREKTRTADTQRLQKKLATDQASVHHAFEYLAAPLSFTDFEQLNGKKYRDPLVASYKLIADYMNFEFKLPTELHKMGGNALFEIVRESRVFVRHVAMKGEWWKDDNGPLMALAPGKQPVALLPKSPGVYEMHDTVKGTVTIVDEAVADMLEPFAYMFYRSFPAKELSILDLSKFGLFGKMRDMRAIITAGVAVGLLGLLVPIATGFIFDTIIPDAARSQLLLVGIILAIIILTTSLFQIVQNIAILRLQGRIGADVQAAVWERVLSLPVAFFRKYTAGDLGARAMGISTIQEMLSGMTLHAMLSGIFSLFSFGLLFYLDARLAVVASALVFGSVVATAFAGYKQVKYQRIITKAQGKISGMVLQTITGISKFRAIGAEGRAFATWAREFSYLKEINYRARDVANNLTVFNAGYTIITLAVIFGMIAFTSQQSISTGTFLAFNAAFAQFLTSVLGLSRALINTLNVVPMYERAKPIFDTLPEMHNKQEDPGLLQGSIEVSHVSFRYTDDSPDVLKDISLKINPGEFVALVGLSGSGKSSLFRLLLGFEAPTSGAVYYDGKDLTNLNIREVRRQIGVVLQSARIMEGDIFMNIVGSKVASLTMDDAWKAAEMAGLAEDIRGMPMEMYTVLNEGGGALSGGQRQRLLIARALINKPRLMFFDEATSALDNRTQSIVSKSLDDLQATRIVIAHRLSTIINADRIYVLENGRITQQGRYEELIKEEGLFAELAKRQMT
jgi:NHLM bacteriocin system ABC transporter ATP-binding protein